MFALVLIALLLGLDNLAAAAAFGLSSPRWKTCARVCGVFTLYAAIAPSLGLIVGPALAAGIGDTSRITAGAILAFIGLARLASAIGRPPKRLTPTDLTNSALLTSGLGVSGDTFVAGFGLGLYGVSIGAAIGVLAVGTLVMSLIGYAVGGGLSTWFQPTQSERFSSAALAVIGVALATGVI